jgi:hypothetical protein
MNAIARLINPGLVCTVLMLASSVAIAGDRQLQVRAPVVDVEPVTEPAMEVEHCADKPALGAGLADTMAWDLGLDCRTERIASDRITGYRVFYRWDDRVYSQMMPNAPGSTIALQVTLD